MKKIILILVLFIMSIGIASCDVIVVDSSKDVTIIMPTGTPSLALAKYASSSDVKAEIVSGSEGLVAAFTNKSHDFIVAPINLGAKMYQTNGSYILYKTFVWGNLYVASKKQITSINDLNGKEVVVFGQNSTPDIVFKSILKNNPELDIKVTYVSDVTSANSLLASSKADYVLSAEPSLTKLKSKFDLYTIDLQEVYAEMTGTSSYPQAGIFVKKELINKEHIKTALEKMSSSIKDAINNPSECATFAVLLHESFKTIGEADLTKAIPNCHYGLLESDKEAVLYYLQTMKDLGFGKQMGENLPDENFFY